MTREERQKRLLKNTFESFNNGDIKIFSFDFLKAYKESNEADRKLLVKALSELPRRQK